MSRYVPLVDGDASLLQRRDDDGAEIGWETANTDVLGDGEALLSLTTTTFGQLTALYGSVEDDPVPPGLADATVRLERFTTVDASGALVSQQVDVVTRDDVGDRLLTVTDASGERVFDPPALILPSDLELGKTWESSGTSGGQDYRITGNVLERTTTDELGDCLRVEISSSLGETTNTSRNVVCAGLGFVGRDDLAPDGSLLQHVELTTQGTLRVSDEQVPNAARPSEAPPPDGPLTLGRVGKATPTSSISPPTFQATFLPTDPPSVVVGSERGDVVALAVDTPDVALWRFHPGGSVYSAPAFDPESGRLYFGATDKRLYSLDVRGYFLWAIGVDDSVATKPVVALDVVAFATEAGTAFGIDTETGETKWETRLSAPAVASPALVDDTAVFGSDDGTLRALDIDDGSTRWTAGAAGSIEAPIVASPDGIVYVADNGGGLAVFEASTGDRVWKVSENDSFRTAPALIGDLIVVVGESGSIGAYDASDGTRAWAFTGTFVGPAAEVDGFDPRRHRRGPRQPGRPEREGRPTARGGRRHRPERPATHAHVGPQRRGRRGVVRRRPHGGSPHRTGRRRAGRAAGAMGARVHRTAVLGDGIPDDGRRARREGGARRCRRSRVPRRPGDRRLRIDR